MGVGSSIWGKICDILEEKYSDEFDEIDYEILEDFLAITSEHNETLEGKMLELVTNGKVEITIEDIIEM